MFNNVLIINKDYVVKILNYTKFIYFFFFIFVVDTKYHKLIYQGDRSFSNLVKSETGNNVHVIIILLIIK